MDIKELIKSFNKEDFYSKVNLHVHSNFSDGEFEFDKLVEQAKNLNMKYISITDHNSVQGYLTSTYKDDEILIKGVEFDCMYNFVLLHILGYGIDPNNKALQAICAQNEQEQKNDLIRLFKSRHPKKVINAIHQAGGIAVLAHPCCCNVFSLDNFVKKLVSFGLDGIETYYPYDRLRGVVKFSSSKLPPKLAQKYSLIQTGGSDEHKDLSNHL
ncbi:MAG: PHP domain-containing protein [Candidatus Gastranaerophilales bacterium]|nr:PHP domain-containing protein [Candidatus Gastranaerophilales bacterium]